MLKLVLCFILLITMGYASEEENSVSLTFIRKETFEISAGQWLLAVDIPINNLSDPIQDLSIRLTSIKNVTVNYLQNISSEFRTEGITLLTETINAIESDVSDLNARIERLIKPIPEQRKTRSYIDILGRGLHALAGLATDDELEQINNRIDSLNEKNKQIVHVLDTQLTYFRSSTSTVAKHESAIRRLDQGFTAIQNFITKTQADIYDKINNIQREIHFMNSVQSIITIAHQNLELLSREIARCEKAENDAWESRLTTNLIKPAEFLKLLQSIDSMLPQSLALIAHPSEDNLLFLYKASRVVLLRRGLNLRFIISLPLRKVGHVFHMYDILPYASNKEGTKIYNVNLETQKLGVSLDSTSFILITPSYLSQCQKGLSLLCPATLPVVTSQYPSCVTSTFLSSNNIVTKYCKTSNVVNAQPIATQGEIPGVWYYLTTVPLDFTFDCLSVNPASNRNWGKVIGRGRIVVPPGCVARNTMFVLDSEWQNKLINISHESAFKILPFAPPTFLTAVHTLSTTPKDLGTMLPRQHNTSAENATELVEERELLRKMDNELSIVKKDADGSAWRVPHSPVITYSLGGGSALLFLTLMVLALVLCRQCKQTSTHPSVVMSPPVSVPTVHYVAQAPSNLCPRNFECV